MAKYEKGVCAECRTVQNIRYEPELCTEPEDNEMGPEGDFVVVSHKNHKTKDLCRGSEIIPLSVIEMREFTLYWLDGKREVVQGDNLTDAFTRAGYSGGAINALDFYADGDDASHAYEWNAEKRRWYMPDSV